MVAGRCRIKALDCEAICCYHIKYVGHELTPPGGRFRIVKVLIVIRSQVALHGAWAMQIMMTRNRSQPFNYRILQVPNLKGQALAITTAVCNHSSRCLRHRWTALAWYKSIIHSFFILTKHASWLSPCCPSTLLPSQFSSPSVIAEKLCTSIGICKVHSKRVCRELLCQNI